MTEIKVTRDDIKEIVNLLLDTFEQEADNLNALDSQTGDGDHGFSMVAGFRAFAKFVNDNPCLSIREMLMQGGFEFNEAAGSTIGVLIYSALKEAGKLVAEDKETLGFSDLASMLDTGTQAIMSRGKASLGQKTILDSLIPAAEKAMELAREHPADMAAAIKSIINICFVGAESTKSLKSGIGRAKWFSERTLGVMDPGAFSGYLIIKIAGEYIQKHNG